MRTEALGAALLLFTAPGPAANHRGPVRTSQSERAPVGPANQRAGQPRLLAQSNTAARGGGNVNMSDLKCTCSFERSYLYLILHYGHFSKTLKRIHGLLLNRNDACVVFTPLSIPVLWCVLDGSKHHWLEQVGRKTQWKKALGQLPRKS